MEAKITMWHMTDDKKLSENTFIMKHEHFEVAIHNFLVSYDLIKKDEIIHEIKPILK